MSSELEASRLYRLTDKQVLDAMRGRGNDLHVVKAFAFLVRMFEKAAKSNFASAPGLTAAIGLTQLYGRTFAPGHEDHPFKDDLHITASVASILDAANGMALPKHAPIARPAALRRGPKPKLAPHIDAKDGFHPVMLNPSTADDTGRVDLRKYKESDLNSKAGKVRAVVATMTGEFTIKDVLARSPDGTEYQDVASVLYAQHGSMKLRKVRPGLYAKNLPGETL